MNKHNYSDLEKDFYNFKLQEKINDYASKKELFETKGEGGLGLFLMGASMIFPIIIAGMLTNCISYYYSNIEQLRSTIIASSLIVGFISPMFVGRKYFKFLKRKYNYKDDFQEIKTLLIDRTNQQVILTYLYEKGKKDANLKSLTENLTLDMKNENYEQAMNSLVKIYDYLSNEKQNDKKNEEVEDYLNSLNVNTKEINGSIKQYL